MSKSRVSVILKKTGGTIVDPRTIRRRGEKLLDTLGLTRAKLSVLLCNDATIRALNKAYRGKDRATDVLSFSMNEGELLIGDPELLGDIVISVETAQRAAVRIKCSVAQEVTSLMIHGLLHLLGYDHSNERDKQKMREQARLLESVITGASKIATSRPKSL